MSFFFFCFLFSYFSSHRPRGWFPRVRRIIHGSCILASTGSNMGSGLESWGCTTFAWGKVTGESTRKEKQGRDYHRLGYDSNYAYEHL